MYVAVFNNKDDTCTLIWYHISKQITGWNKYNEYYWYYALDRVDRIYEVSDLQTQHYIDQPNFNVKIEIFGTVTTSISQNS